MRIRKTRAHRPGFVVVPLIVTFLLACRRIQANDDDKVDQLFSTGRVQQSASRPRRRAPPDTTGTRAQLDTLANIFAHPRDRSTSPPSNTRTPPVTTPSPTRPPTTTPNFPPTPTPTETPNSPPTSTGAPTPPPTSTRIQEEEEEVAISYQPGNFSLGHTSDGDGSVIRLSNGLSARRIAISGQRLVLADGSLSQERFHLLPDAAGIFSNNNNNNDNYYYVSNAEVDVSGNQYNHGGVGVLEFNPDGAIVQYRRLLNSTRRNCGGGKTPWNSWISCEEYSNGRVHQVDPFDTVAPQQTALGELGWYESFAYDTTSGNLPTFYVTRDRSNGVLTRFTPNAVGMTCFREVRDVDRWCTLNHGTLDYLELLGGDSATGSFQWTTNMLAAEQSAERYYPFSEGIDSVDGTVYFVSKKLKRLVILNLEDRTYTWSSTKNGAFEHQPDQVARLVNDDRGVLYFCEDGGDDPGVHGRSISSSGEYFTILHFRAGVVDKDETSGLSFSPDQMHMYVVFQHSGQLYDVTRRDKRPFGGATLDIKYHAE